MIPLSVLCCCEKLSAPFLFGSLVIMTHVLDSTTDALLSIVERGSGGNEQSFERMSIPLPFPEDVLEEIRLFDGNNKCCDCPSLDTDWASVSHGTLICLDCAGRHRGLGVHVSFVRSITMDTWSTQQV